MISFIVAMDKNNIIGNSESNDMPWHLPNDLQYFKTTTSGHTIIMGRKTFASLGRVLPNRDHIVLTKKEPDVPEEVDVYHDIDDVIALAKNYPDEEWFVIGGGTIFEQFFEHADRLYVTMIEESFSGDVYFPTISSEEWQEVSRKKGLRDEKNPYDYYYTIYERK
ncbi:MAG TPA: dihydrofolate reductase [Pseudogracilibacillus sp.]|nr:dihydrofolate reductase [Pseudogracilibacillus sp.]